ncbi:MAG: M23 family metallopeptidase, partial [Sorangiineae bacterium]|nr:M23 family metallopeptidase [Sorangiineae bacterium]
SAGTGGGSAGTGGAAGSGGAGGGGGGDPYANPICNGNMSGLYCGKSEMTGADPDVLYHCSGVVGTPPDSATPCPEGCVAEVHGKADHCAVATSPDSYKLPWRAGTSMQLTQDCNDSCCADHVGAAGYAWDFANGTSFTIVAARGGTITHLKDNSTTGCGTKSCVDDANYLVIDHGDGTQSVYLHLLGNSLEPGVTCGATVTQGQALARAGTTGWSTGLHLHFQVSKVHPGAATCECGASGMGCSASSVAWGSFWSSSSYPTVAVDFVEWQGSACGNRRGALPASQN